MKLKLLKTACVITYYVIEKLSTVYHSSPMHVSHIEACLDLMKQAWLKGSLLTLKYLKSDVNIGI